MDTISEQTNIKKEEAEVRRERLDAMKEMGIKAYANKFERTATIADAKKLPISSEVSLAGRLMLLRQMGKMTFAHLQDYSGKMQIVLKSDLLGKDSYKALLNILDVGDFIGIEGEIFKTRTEEISVLVKKYEFLSKALRPLPEKWHGLKDIEVIYRKRYLDLIMNNGAKERFKFRSDFIWELRKFYKERGFEEIETPILCNTPSGALAKPFKTHYNALEINVYLRIAPEIHLKEAIIGGYEKIFEVGRCFRNEGMDSSHLQDFTMVEHYCAYWDYKKNMEFLQDMLSTIIKKLKGTLNLQILNRSGELHPVNFAPPWETVSFRDLIKRDCGIDIDKLENAESLLQEIKKRGIELESPENLGRGNLIDELYKKVSRNKLINPTFLVDHPIDLSPLARKNDQNSKVADRFQLIINGWEISNAYSELIDPIDQKDRFEAQMEAKKKGDEEAMLKDEEYLEAMEYGMPPVSGLGMGIERIVALLCETPNLRDVVLFPLLKPKSN